MMSMPQDAAEACPTSPLRLFYFQGRNFGDSLSADVVKHLYKGRVRFAPPHDADLAAIGSIMGMIRKGFQTHPRREKKLAVWGSGCMNPEAGFDRDKIEVFAIRGAISASLLGLSSKTPMGDPGLFADELINERPVQTDRIGLIPHHNLADSEELHSVISAEPSLRLIDPRTKNAKAVVEQIASCAHVVSSSLHGLVVADSLRVPNTWLDPRGNHWYSELKFLDYASALGRPMKRPVELSELRKRLASITSVQPYWQENVAEAKEELRIGFKRALEYVMETELVA